MIFTEIALNGILEIKETPFVSSTIPAKKPFAKDKGRCKVSSKGDARVLRISNTLVLLRMEIITLKSITKPPIITIVLIELIILFWRIVPKLLKVGAIFLFSFTL